MPSKHSATSEMDNQTDTILDSGGFTTNKPNCAAQLTGRNYVHLWTSSVHARRCIRATSPAGSCVSLHVAFTAACSAPD